MGDESASRGLFGRRKHKESQGSESATEAPVSPDADESAIAAAAEREAMARLEEAELRADSEPEAAGPPPSRGAAEGAEEVRRRLSDRIDAARGISDPPVEAEPPRPIEDRLATPSPSPGATAEFVPSAEHEAAAADPGDLTDALADEIAADLGAVEAEAGTGSAGQLERAENVIAARERRFDAALARARDRLSDAEERASAAEQRAQRAQELTAFQERERRQADELRAVLERISAAEERAREADTRISDLIAATVSPPEIESLLSAEADATPADPGERFEPPTAESFSPFDAGPVSDSDPEPLTAPQPTEPPPAPPLALAPDPGSETVPGLAATEPAETDPSTSPPVEPGVPEPPVHLSAAPDPFAPDLPAEEPSPAPSEGASESFGETPAPAFEEPSVSPFEEPPAAELPDPVGSPAPAGDPRIDLNVASSQDLRVLGTPVIGIGRILAERERRGGFSSVDDLDQVKGLDPELLARLKGAMRVDPSA